MSSIIQAVGIEPLTYLDEPALRDLFEQAQAVEETGRPGILIEAGCALGGSAIVIAAAKAKARPLHVYDVFGMIPPPSEHDGPDVQERYNVIKAGRAEGLGNDKYYGYVRDLLQRVTENFSRHNIPIESNNVHLVKGLFQDTMRVNEPVAFAHLDGDWYESVMTCLRQIEPHLVPGGVMVIDDYGYWSGCRKAVDEYFGDKQDRYKFVRRARLNVVRNSE